MIKTDPHHKHEMGTPSFKLLQQICRGLLADISRKDGQKLRSSGCAQIPNHLLKLTGSQLRSPAASQRTCGPRFLYFGRKFLLRELAEAWAVLNPTEASVDDFCQALEHPQGCPKIRRRQRTVNNRQVNTMPVIVLRGPRWFPYLFKFQP